MKKKKTGKTYCYMNGKVVPVEKASLSVFDIGVLRAYAVFDVLYARSDKPFLIRDHWKRLANSARDLGLQIPVTYAEWQRIITILLQKNGFPESNVRTVLTGGVGPNGYLPGKETFYILVTSFSPLPVDVYETGSSVITYDYCRTLPQSKTTHYVTAIRLERNKQKKKALEIVYVDCGKVLEAATSNVFIVSNGIVITPKNDVLSLGTVRNAVIRIAKKTGVVIEERDVSIEEFFSADEILLTATNKGLVPVVSVDGKKIGTGRPGEVTLKLREKYETFKDRALR